MISTIIIIIIMTDIHGNDNMDSNTCCLLNIVSNYTI